MAEVDFIRQQQIRDKQVREDLVDIRFIAALCSSLIKDLASIGFGRQRV